MADSGRLRAKPVGLRGVPVAVTQNSSAPVISAVMPRCNHDRFIDDAIRSVVSQTMNNWELIIVDDHCTDGSKRVIDEWLGKESRIAAAFHTKREGIGKTMNDEIRLARGKYLVPMASDDMFRSDAFEEVPFSLLFSIRSPMASLERSLSNPWLSVDLRPRTSKNFVEH